MSTTDNTFLYTLPDLMVRRIANNRMGVYRLMKQKDDPFPAPIVMNEGKRKPGTSTYSGRRVAWRVVEVKAWLDRRQKAGSAA